jgi:DnaJ like chaperone protein
LFLFYCDGRNLNYILAGLGIEQGNTALNNNTGFRIPGHWWGKLIGGIIGLLRGGIAGAILGIFIGHMVDRFLAGLGGVSRVRDAFFGAMFATLGHVSKADGRVSRAEIAAAEELMRRLQLDPEERQRAIQFFQQGKQPDFDLDATLREFARRSMLRHELRIMFVELLLEVALADGLLNPSEEQVLQRACMLLHIPANVYAAMRRARDGGAQSGSGSYQQVPRQVHSIQQDYASLGLKPDASAQDIKRAYRKLVSQYHPDKLVSQGLPEEMMEMSRRRVREINAAYDRIKASRGIK